MHTHSWVIYTIVDNVKKQANADAISLFVQIEPW